jgi:hypothetical protein
MTGISDSVSYSRAMFLVPGMLFLLVDLLEFSQLISFYLFLDMDMPGNLRTILKTLYDSMQLNLIPITIPTPF